MKNILKLEEAAMFGLCIYALIFFQAPWWVFLLLLLGPDVSMLGYLGGNKAGAICYNFFHHKAVGILLFFIGIKMNSSPGDAVALAGIVMFGHSSLDRMLGYGLKLSEGFKYTHLGIIGKNK